MSAANYFPAALRAFPSRAKIAGLRHPALTLRPSASHPGAGPDRPLAFGAMKAARVAVKPMEHPMSEHNDHQPHQASSPTDHLLTELQLYGYRPFVDEPDPRPLPEGHVVAGAIADIFDALLVEVQAQADFRQDI